MSPLRHVAPVALALVTIMTACGDTTDGNRSQGSGPTSTTTLAPQAFANAVRARDLDALTATFADNIQLYSPVLTDPFVGRARVTRLFGVLIDVFQDIRITHEFVAPGRYALSFHARVGSEPIQIVDLLEFDRTGRIETFTVTGRPLAGVQALAAAVAPHLPSIG